MSKNNDLKKEVIIKRLTERMFQHRSTSGLSQKDAAESLGKSEKTYQRWESDGSGLSDIFNILNVFRVLHFSTTEMIEVLGLPPLELSEIKELYQDDETLKSIQENSIYTFVRKTCGGMESITIEKLLCVLLKEYFKRKGYIM